MSVVVCVWCGQEFEAKRSDSLFCNPACKQKYWRWKHGLQLERKQIMVCIDAITEYLSNKRTCDEAALVLGEVADRLLTLGFVGIPENVIADQESIKYPNRLRGESNA